MLLTATSYLMVNYGSEARGYAGMILCMILAVMFFEDIMNGKKRHFALVGATFIGTLFHFDMALAVAVFAVTCFWLTAEKSTLPKAVDETLQIFLLPCIAILAVILPQILLGYTFGFIAPFNFEKFLGADNLALQTALDILPRVSLPDGDLLIAIIAALLWFGKHRGDARAMFFTVALVALPVALWALHVPNTDVPRHMLLCGIAYIMLMATIVEAGWRKGSALRLAAVAAIVIALIGDGFLLQKFLANGRGHYSDAVARIAANGPATYGIDQQQLTPMIDFYAKRLGVAPPSFVAMNEWCTKGAPQFLILLHVWPAPMPDAHVMQGPEACRTTYDQMQDYPAWGLTGADWVLFKRQ